MTWTRRKFIRTSLFIGAGLLLTDSLWAEKFFIETNEFFVGDSNKNNVDIKVLQISDLHLKSLSYQLKQLTKKINEINPDLIFITGDAIDDGKNIYLLNNFLKLIDKGIRKVAILGNWEYWGKVNIEDLSYLYKEHNCDLLINQSKQYFFRNKTISVTGVDDYIGGEADIIKALKEYKASDFHIILNHCPQYSDEISDSINKEINVDFILSGHTHGGQINLFGFVPFLPQGSGKYLKGWYKDSKRKLYVSKGIGTSIFPARFMARAEIAIFNLA